jgi:hypothetical protein
VSFPRYPKYKASGVEWLGEAPVHWTVVRLRQLGQLLKGSGGSKEDAHTLMSTQALNSESVRRGLKDILLNHTGLYEDLRGSAGR